MAGLRYNYPATFEITHVSFDVMDDAQRLNNVDQLLLTIGQRAAMIEQTLERCPRNVVLRATLRTLRNQERLLQEAREAMIEAALASIVESTLN